MRKFIFIIGIIFLLLLANSYESVNSFAMNSNQAYAAITETNLQNLTKVEPVSEENEQKSDMPSVFTLMGALFSVIGLILVSGWLYSEFNNANIKKMINKKEDLNLNKFKIISTQHLGTNKSIHLIEIANRKLVIGVTTNSISLITDISGNEMTNKIIAPDSEQNDITTSECSDEINNKEDILYKLSDIYKDYIKN